MNAARRYPHTLRIGRYLQDIATFYTDLDGMSARKVCAIARSRNGMLCCGLAEGLEGYSSALDRWEPFATADAFNGAVRGLTVDPNGGLIVISNDGVYRIDSIGEAPKRICAVREVVKVACVSGRPDLLLLTPKALIDGAGRIVAVTPHDETGIALVVTSDGVILMGTDRGLYRCLEGGLHPISRTLEVDPANSQSRAVMTALAVDDYGQVWAATERGIGLYVEDSWLDIGHAATPPIHGADHLVRAPDGALWLGSQHGVARLHEGVWRYFAGGRWLPSDRVNDLWVDPDGGAWIATDAGIVHIARRSMMLEDKAAHYQAITQARHDRLGYVGDCLLTHPGNYDTVLPHASDNDGLWTSLYVCAECFRYAVTGDRAAGDRARSSLRALLDLVRLTGIRGFPARALIRRGERVHQSDPGANWYPSPVDEEVIYKNDTSSDEIDGHYLAWYVAYELVADDALRAEIAAACQAVTDHILDHDYTLVGPTGKATRWGVWGPGALNDDPEWAAERGLNALEILSHLKVAMHLCPCARYEAAYRELIATHHYALNSIMQKVMPPDGEENHSDDELAACAYYPLLQLEEDPALRQLYLIGLERTFALLRSQRSPFYNVIYGACTLRSCGAEEAAEWLRDAPMDLRQWGAHNSLRPDVQIREERDRFGRLQTLRALPPSEIVALRWNHNPYQADHEGEGAVEMDGSFWLLPYWMGRYQGIFVEDQRQDQA